MYGFSINNQYCQSVCPLMLNHPCGFTAILYMCVYIYIYSRTSIIQTPVCHFNVKGVQINEFVRISELSDKIHYLASYIQ